MPDPADDTGRALDVLVVGGIGTDESVFLPAPLRPGTYAHAHSQLRSTAGSAATVAAALIDSGLSVAIAGAVGTDNESEWLTEAMMRLGVQCHVRHVPGPSARSLVLVDPDGERTIIGLTGDLLDCVEVPTALLPEIRAVVFPAWRPQFGASLAAAQEAGCRTIIGLRGLADRTICADVAIGSREELGDTDLTDASERFPVIVVTEGQHGSYLVTKDGLERSDPFNVEPVDATGAGDAFLAGFAAEWIRYSALQVCMEMATAWGALATERLGATPPPFAAVQTLLEGLR